eukprot:g47200.t1
MAEGAPSSSSSSVASASTAEESCSNVDTKNHSINDAFANRNAQGEGNNAGEVLLLQNANYPTDLKVTVGRDVPRRNLREDGVCSSIVHRSFSPWPRRRHRGHLEWDQIGIDDWIYFLRATSKAASVSLMLEDAETTVSLAKVLRIIKRVFDKRFYVRFVFCYKNKNNVVRILRSTPDWIHGVVPQPFQELLNLDPQAAFPFTTKDKSLEELVKSIARCLQWSDRQAGKSKSGQSSLSDTESECEPGQSSYKQTSQELIQVKIELVALQAKLEKAEAACREAADKLRAAEAGDNEAKKLSTTLSYWLIRKGKPNLVPKLRWQM